MKLTVENMVNYITLKNIRSIFHLAQREIGEDKIYISIYSEAEARRSSDWSRNRDWEVVAEGLESPEEMFACIVEAIINGESYLEKPYDLILWFEDGYHENKLWAERIFSFLTYIVE